MQSESQLAAQQVAHACVADTPQILHPQQQHPIPFRLLHTQPTDWDPGNAAVALNVRLDGCIVPSEAAPEGARVSYSHLVVIDEFVSDQTRQQLLDYLTCPTGPGGCTAGSGLGGASGSGAEAAVAHHAAAGAAPEVLEAAPHGSSEAHGVHGGFALPAECWERATADLAGGVATWGVRPHVLRALASAALPALREVHARLCKLFPECDIAHLPSHAIQLRHPATPAAPGVTLHRQASRDAGCAPGPCKAQLLGGERPAATCEAVAPHDAAGSCSAAKLPAHKRPRFASPGARPAGQRATDVVDARLDATGLPAEQQAAEAAAEGAAAGQQSGSLEGSGDGAAGVDCDAFVANAAVEGDSYCFHVDADPTSFPDGSPWVDAYGDYCNGEPGRPLLVSLMLYLNPEWRRDWGAETLFLDAQSDSGVFVRPRPARAVLFDQDLLHRVSPPSAAASGRPRFSLVWKLALLPRTHGQALCLARPEWGRPSALGSAARVEAVMRQLAAEARQSTAGVGREGVEAEGGSR